MAVVEVGLIYIAVLPVLMLVVMDRHIEREYAALRHFPSSLELYYLAPTSFAWPISAAVANKRSSIMSDVPAATTALFTTSWLAELFTLLLTSMPVWS